MYAAVKTLVTLLSLLIFIDRLGRRKLLLASSLGCTLSLWYVGAYITAKHIDIAATQTQPTSRSAAGWFAIVCIYIYAVSYPFDLIFLSSCVWAGMNRWIVDVELRCNR